MNIPSSPATASDGLTLEFPFSDKTVLAGFFLRPTALRRHRAGPLARERELFLLDRIAQGYNQQIVQSLASALLRVVEVLRMEELRQVRLAEIEVAGDAWAADSLVRRKGCVGLHSKTLFMTAAKLFLNFHGCLDTRSPGGPFSHELETFLKMLAEQRGFAEATLRSYRDILQNFFVWLRTRRSSLKDTNVSDIVDFLAFKRTTCSAVGMRGVTQRLRGFLAFAESRGWCSSFLQDPLRILPRRGPRSEITIPSWEDVRRILEPRDNQQRGKLRARAFLFLASIYGLRVSEIAKLRLKDIDWREETLRVRRAKNGQTQHYPLQYEVGSVIRDYIVLERPKCVCDSLFITLTRPYRAIRPIDATHVARMRMKTLNIQATRLGAHTLRHCCATQLLRSGSSLREIADFLGHRGIGTVSTYTKFDTESLQEVAVFSFRGVL